MRGRIIVLMLLVLALPVAAFVPKGERIAKATAKANEAAARSQALQLDITLRVADREPIGSGKLVTHPTGLARLELRDASDRIERHLLLGTEHSASRNGRKLERPRAFLPPLFFLQVNSPATFEQALSDFGLDIEAASLAPCGKILCYVLGDASRVAPLPAGPEEPEEEPSAVLHEEPSAVLHEEPSAVLHEEPSAVLLHEEPSAMLHEEPSAVLHEEPSAMLHEEPSAAPKEEPSATRLAETTPAPPAPTIWVDAKTFEIVRIESRSGVTVDFGPVIAFGEVRFPESMTIREPGREPVRFDILGVVPVNAPAAEFTHTWLLAPTSDSDAFPAGPP